MTPRYDEIGNRLKAFRLASGLSADEIAKKIGISRTALYRFEKGELAKIETLEKLADLSASPIEKFSPSARFRLGEQPNVRVGIATITSAPAALALHESMAKICGDVRSADRRRPNISDGACRARRRIVPELAATAPPIPVRCYRVVAGAVEPWGQRRRRRAGNNALRDEGFEAVHAKFDNNVPAAVGSVERLDLRDAAQREVEKDDQAV